MDHLKKTKKNFEQDEDIQTQSAYIHTYGNLKKYSWHMGVWTMRVPVEMASLTAFELEQLLCLSLRVRQNLYHWCVCCILAQADSLFPTTVRWCTNPCRYRFITCICGWIQESGEYQTLRKWILINNINVMLAVLSESKRSSWWSRSPPGQGTHGSVGR